VWTTAAAVVVLVFVGIGIGLERVLFSANPCFVLRHIKVDVVGKTQAARVLDILRELQVVPHSTNIFAVDPALIRDRLEREVLVSRATVVRRLPGTLVVGIYERRPIAQFCRRGHLLLDDDGRLLPPQLDTQSLMLPIITGVGSAGTARTAGRVKDELVLGALQFLRLLATRPDGQQYYDVAVVQLDYSHPSLIVHLRERPPFRENAIIIVPVRGMEAALDRAKRILKLRQEAGQETGFLDVTYDVNVPARP
jgi:hypothetical protein